MQKRRYEVSGVHDLGDLHVFLSDDRERAQGVCDVMREELAEVHLLELSEVSD
ncbi:hypothetical protein [Sphingosinicella rhizophila]|uniref:Uncharacterized protein n=1 Tax=Sphingosinicella rhizophila TaxID=3050082 RepID=A0ABU3Q932_9SPHN|nr:hypothetical protein [Sphingosinicella sp. GR2756]MDT9599918.1 hypothetical protein [Sphingosinicella sp. GR2756]